MRSISSATSSGVRLQAINPHIRIETIPAFATPELLAELVPQYDLVLDGTDNFLAKYAINDACDVAGVPLVYGSIFQFEGQVSVFHHPTEKHPKGFTYRDLYPDAPPAGLSQNCGEAGVIGVLPGIIGTLQANEAIKVLTGLGETLSGQLLIYDAFEAVTRRLTLTHREQTATHQAITPGDISFEEWKIREAGAKPPVLVDVREADEREAASLGGIHIPLATLPKRLGDLPDGQDIVVYCKSGVRSAKAALYLRSIRPDVQVYNLKGGVVACIDAGIVGTA